MVHELSVNTNCEADLLFTYMSHEKFVLLGEYFGPGQLHGMGTSSEQYDGMNVTSEETHQGRTTLDLESVNQYMGKS